jgi:hypothetical protein
MAQEPTASASIFCRKCDYSLVGLSANRCPECGRPFDPADPRTFLSHPRSWLLRRWGRRIGCVLLCLAVPIVILLGGACWGWARERPAVLTIRAANGKISAPASGMNLGTFTGTFVKATPGIARWSGYLWAYSRLAKTGLLDRVYSIELTGSQATDSALHEVWRLKGLQQAIIWDSPITDEGIACLSRAPNLASLTLRNTRITSKGIARTREFTRLRFLQIIGTPITAEDIGHIKRIPGLTALLLEDAQMDDSHLILLKDMTRLNGLNLNENRITDSGLVNLAGLANLVWLGLDHTQITDAGMAQVARLPSLASLDLSGTQVTDAGLKALANAKSLQYLNLLDTKVTPQGVRSLQNTALQTVQVHGP